MDKLVLGLFSGIGLLDQGFERAGYCVVKGPDLIWGSDIRSFSPPAGRFDGIIAGSPCQDFSKARRSIPATGEGVEMLEEFRRCVESAQPVWWLLENVAGVPDMKIDGYSWQRLDLYAHEFGLSQRRLRHIQFGSSDETVLVRRDALMPPSARRVTPTITASDDTIPMSRVLAEMGLPPDFDIPSFTRAELRKAIGNGVPLPMAEALGAMVRDRVDAEQVRLCGCSCGRSISAAATYAGQNCRKRMSRRRDPAPHV